MFRDLALAQIITPTSKVDSLRVLDETGVAAPRNPGNLKYFMTLSDGTPASEPDMPMASVELVCFPLGGRRRPGRGIGVIMWASPIGEVQERVAMPDSTKHWEHQVDFVVVGSGCGGLTAALAGDACKLDTLIIEKAGVYGGSTALSGGNIWIPNNPTLKRAGLEDSRTDVRRYLDAIVEYRVPSVNLDAFIDYGPPLCQPGLRHPPPDAMKGRGLRSS